VKQYKDFLDSVTVDEYTHARTMERIKRGLAATAQGQPTCNQMFKRVKTAPMYAMTFVTCLVVGAAAFLTTQGFFSNDTDVSDNDLSQYPGDVSEETPCLLSQNDPDEPVTLDNETESHEPEITSSPEQNHTEPAQTLTAPLLEHLIPVDEPPQGNLEIVGVPNESVTNQSGRDSASTPTPSNPVVTVSSSLNESAENPVPHDTAEAAGTGTMPEYIDTVSEPVPSASFEAMTTAAVTERTTPRETTSTTRTFTVVLPRETTPPPIQSSVLWLEHMNLTCGDLADMVNSGQIPKNLRELHLSGNHIKDISPLSELTNLQRLWLGNNLIEDITPLSGLTNLTILSLRTNYVDDVQALSGLENLELLVLQNNLISDITPLTELTKLESLQLHNNDISDITPLSELRQLRGLNLNNNEIVDVSPLMTLSNLRILDLSNNQISSAAMLLELPKLSNLWLDGNRIRSRHAARIKEVFPNAFADAKTVKNDDE
jgi:Leucine-rich repeat (LRR) protein